MNFILSRVKRIGGSLSAATTFFDLFDRTPTIDNGSSQGVQLVSITIPITRDSLLL